MGCVVSRSWKRCDVVDFGGVARRTNLPQEESGYLVGRSGKVWKLGPQSPEAATMGVDSSSQPEGYKNPLSVRNIEPIHPQIHPKQLLKLTGSKSRICTVSLPL